MLLKSTTGHINIHSLDTSNSVLINAGGPLNLAFYISRYKTPGNTSRVQVDSELSRENTTGRVQCLLYAHMVRMRFLSGFQINTDLCKSAAKLCAIRMTNEDKIPFSVFTGPDVCENGRKTMSGLVQLLMRSLVIVHDQE